MKNQEKINKLRKGMNDMAKSIMHHEEIIQNLEKDLISNNLSVYSVSAISKEIELNRVDMFNIDSIRLKHENSLEKELKK